MYVRSVLRPQSNSSIFDVSLAALSSHSARSRRHHPDLCRRGQCSAQPRSVGQCAQVRSRVVAVVRVLIGSSVVARQFFSRSPVTRVVVGCCVRTRAPPPCRDVHHVVLRCEPPTDFPSEWAPVYRGCPVGTHQSDLVSRVGPDQSANSCVLASSCVVLRRCVDVLWSA